MTTRHTVIISAALVLTVSVFCGTWVHTSKIFADSKSIPNPPEDKNGRFTFREYHQGNLVGLAMVDTKIGRVWLLTQMTDDRGRRVRDDLVEVAVEGLWKSETSDPLPLDSPGTVMQKMLMEVWRRTQGTKRYSRPFVVQEANNRINAEMKEKRAEREKRSEQQPKAEEKESAPTDE